MTGRDGEGREGLEPWWRWSREPAVAGVGLGRAVEGESTVLVSEEETVVGRRRWRPWGWGWPGRGLVGGSG